ncbi:MAG: hypothetical protein IPH69_06915 [Bacteroidales bacterium]|nr:hypothetical protein [Bacteroidales bacterium]MBK7627712.1 hypothetical protein [Bacteroidales bacterium]
MKKLILILVIATSILACKKTKFDPEGPTDVRIKNISDQTFSMVIVNTSGGIDTLGNVLPGALSEYGRFEKAFIKAEVSAKINGQIFSTGAVDYRGLTYMGQVKMTYEVWISDFNNKKLDLKVVYPLDAPLD